jgi:hypothetical protein
VQVNAAQARGAKCYNSREEAQANCKPKDKTCWTCIDGQVLQLTETEARNRGGQCYGSRGEAARACKPIIKPTAPPRPDQPRPFPTRPPG